MAKKRGARVLDPVQTCAWCGCHIPPDQEVFGIGARARAGTDLADREGQTITLHILTADRDALAIVAGADSEARRQGYDLVFMACSEACTLALRAALQGDVALGDALGA